MSSRMSIYLRDDDEIGDIEYWEAADGRGALLINVGGVGLDFYGMESAEHEVEFASKMADAFDAWRRAAVQRAIEEG